MPLFEAHRPASRSRLALLLVAALAAVALSGAPSAHAAGCRHADVVFYSTDTARLVSRLALNASPCADYYVSVTPGGADSTLVRSGVAGTIHAAGPHFHGMPEIRTAAWATWIAANGSSWFDAGVEARRRMVAAGYDVTAGDTWAVNEATPDVLANTGTARTDLREFVRGLYTGDTGMPPSAGLVFVTNPVQVAPDVSQYKQQLQDWLADTPFWTDMSSYVRFWAQETYADTRNWGVPGASLTDRREHLEDYLMHGARLAAAGPGSTTAAAQAFLARAYTPVGNAAWPQTKGFGYTNVPAPTMEAFIAAQTSAMRHAQAPGGDRFGFAWVPVTSGIPAATFIEMLDRLAAAIHSSDDADADGIGACGSDRSLCDGIVDGAAFTEVWKAFAPPILTVPSPIAVDATGPSGAAVSYAATASSPFDRSPAVACAPPSGSTFPIGTTTVECVATDSAGNRSTASFAVVVRGAVEQMQNLAAEVAAAAAIPAELNAWLVAKVNGALAGFDPASPADVRRVCIQLGGFVTVVRIGENSRLIAPAVGDPLIADATRTRAVLAC